MTASAVRGPRAIVSVEGRRSLASPASVSVILSTYNSPAWLEKVIWGYSAQTFSDFELVIADDGSTSETSQLLHRLRDQTGLNIRHVWHEHQGFRKSTILNRATEVAAGEYLVYSDGDCIPRHDFLAAHVQSASPNHFLSGGCYRLPMALSQSLAIDDILERRAFSTRWLRRNGLRANLKLLKLLAGNTWGACLNHLTFTRATWNGHNASGWKADVLAANGYDERMRYGGQDRELGERLVNAGVRPRQIRYSAICLHLDHERAYVNADDWQRNREIRRETRQSGAVFTPYGIRQTPEAEVATRRAA